MIFYILIGGPMKLTAKFAEIISELSQHDKDFAHVMALKLRLCLEKKEVIVNSLRRL